MRALFHVFACAGSIATRLFFGKTVTVRDPRYFWRLLSAVCVHFLHTSHIDTRASSVASYFSQLKIAKANFTVERSTKPFWSLFDPGPCSFSLLALKCARHTVERQVVHAMS